MVIIGPTLGFAVGLFSIVKGLDVVASITLWITVWTALWWVFEAVPIPVASLVPIFLGFGLDGDGSPAKDFLQVFTPNL